MSADRLLTVTGVSKSFGGLLAVDQATLDVEQGSITALIGPNGAGKTTLFNLITGFMRPETGTVTFDGAKISGKTPHAIARRGMVRTFQITKALTKMSVLDNMMLAEPAHPGEHFWGALFSSHAPRERRIRARAMELLDLVKLQAHADAYAGTLSGGQRKLLELARALMARPRLLLLDEPMAGINPTLGRELLTLIHRLREEHEMTFLYIEHDMEVVMNNSDRVIVMAEGTVIADGAPDVIKNNQAVIDAYLGTRAP